MTSHSSELCISLMSTEATSPEFAEFLAKHTALTLHVIHRTGMPILIHVELKRLINAYLQTQNKSYLSYLLQKFLQQNVHLVITNLIQRQLIGNNIQLYMDLLNLSFCGKTEQHDGTRQRFVLHQDVGAI
jgi:hypothetical protein